jgi:hypothetical protein
MSRKKFTCRRAKAGNGEYNQVFAVSLSPVLYISRQFLSVTTIVPNNDMDRDTFTTLHNNIKSWDSAVGTATGYGSDDEGSEFESRWGQEFSLLHVVQTDFGAHPVSCKAAP